MRHGMANKKLNRTSEHRKALLKNMLNSLIKYRFPKEAAFLNPMLNLRKTFLGGFWGVKATTTLFRQPPMRSL